MPFGYNGKVLRIDLSTKKMDVETPSESFYRTHMGGGCLSLFYLLRELKPGIDPLGPENVLVFASGVLSGIPMSGMARFTVAAHSPLTGGFGESEAAGYWGPELKHAGFDAIIIKGKAEKPVYIWVHNGEVEIRDASHLWGTDTGATQESIRKELDDNLIRVAMIGQAGENLVRYACVINNLGHANGRTGMGAVMGSKNLKAIAVRGTQKLEVQDPEGLRAVSQSLTETIKVHPVEQTFQKLGTPNVIMPLNNQGILPTRNFTRSQFEGAQKISGETMEETISIGNGTCYACAVRCKRKVSCKGRYEVSPEYGGPEYETIASLGSCLEIDDLEAIAKGHELCNRYSLDTISTGMCIAFAMECFENGLLTEEDTEGLKLTFGNAGAMLEMIERTAFRRGLGNLLAEGLKRASEKLGQEAKRYALHVKGQEVPMHEPRGKFGVGFGYAVSPTGADHLEAAHDPVFQQEGPGLEAMAPLGILEPVPAVETGPQKIRLFRHAQLIWNLWNSLGICYFVAQPPWALSLGDVVKTVRCVTGWNTSLFELMQLSDRSMAMARIFNLREGFGRKDDTWPERLFEPLPDGPNKGQTFTKVELEMNKDLYYEMMGWDKEDGRPTRGKLIELNLEYLAE
ncbi:MAG: aldehyde ferredoxin oxidoreductase [Proteobacteria bacterium]|nr:aldehyde ferredoxin oxidoreductase [Pseudomonadota bacterium]